MPRPYSSRCCAPTYPWIADMFTRKPLFLDGEVVALGEERFACELGEDGDEAVGRLDAALEPRVAVTRAADTLAEHVDDQHLAADIHADGRFRLERRRR